ncbi:MAG: DMT family transporter [Qingshengfaniella sp.]
MVSSAADVPASRPLTAILWMVLTGLLFVGVQATVKVIGPDIPAAQSAFLRYLLGVVLMAPMWPHLIRTPIARADLRLFVGRGVLHTLGVGCWFYAMTQITLAEVTAMNYLAPIYVTIGAALFLGETLSFRRILAIVVALIGGLIILRPGVRALGAGHVAMLVTGLSFGISYLMAKVFSNRYPPDVVVMMLTLTVTVGLAPFALLVWAPVSLVDMGLLTLVAAFATAGHYTMVLAFRAAPITVTQPATFLQLVWAVLLGALVFGEPLDGWVMTGGGVIVAAISFMAWREAVARRRATTPNPMQTKT